MDSPHYLRTLVLLSAACMVAAASGQTIFDATTAEVVPAEIHLWSDGAKSLSLVDAGDAAFSRVADTRPGGRIPVLRIHSEGSAASLVIGRECPIDATTLEFAYFLPEGAPVWSLGAGMRVKEDNNVQTQVRFPPVFGRWQTERFPLASLMRGDLWRAGTARTASSLEIGAIAEKGGEPFDLYISSIRLLHEPGPCTPLLCPMRLPGRGTFSRTFKVSGAPEKAWLMAFARPGFKVSVNGREIGTGGWCNAEAWPCRKGSAPVAAEFPLTTVLRDGGNAVEIAVADGPDAECALALGWIDGDGRHVVVSDGDWLRDGEAAKAEPLSDSPRPGFFDIYPVRPPTAWLPPAERPDYTASPQHRPEADALRVGPEEGLWGTTRDESGRWFFSAPSGHRFFLYGIQTVNCFRQNYGYLDWARRAYPDENAWAADAVAFVQRLGYNAVGVAASARSAFDEAARRGMLNLEYVGCADAGPFLVNAQGKRLVGLCDPFDPEFRRRLRERLVAVAPGLNARPAVFGICVGNEAHIEGNVASISSSGYVYSEACGREFARWLRERYGGDVALLNRAWFGSRESEWLQTFDEVLERKPDPFDGHAPVIDDPEYVAAMAHLGRPVSAGADGAPKGAMREDFDAFAVHTVRVYAETVLDLTREFFPDKLIGSNRFLGGATEEMYRCWRGYDFIAVNTYPMMVRGDAVFTDRQMEALRLAHRATGRPVVLTEWGVQAMDVCLQSPSATLWTQAERGQGYSKALRQVVEGLPFVAGMVDFGFQNLADSEGQGWGIVDNEGRPYHDYIDGIIEGACWLDAFLERNDSLHQSSIP